MSKKHTDEIDETYIADGVAPPGAPAQPRTLILLRHAKAEPHTATDIERALTLHGRSQALAVGDAIAAHGPHPEVALVSTAVRTKQTWHLAASRLDREVPTVLRRELYGTGPRGVIEILNEVEDASVVIVVGHEPTVSETAAHLADEQSDPRLVHRVRHGIPTAARCVLEVPVPWAELELGGARLVAVERAKED